MQDATIRAEEGDKESKNKILVSLKVYMKQERKQNEQQTKGI